MITKDCELYKDAQVQEKKYRDEKFANVVSFE